MNGKTILVSTQTPLYRFEGEGKGGPIGPDLPAHRLSPGGVCRMVLPTLQNFREEGWMKRAYWYSLQPGAPASVDIEDGAIQLRHIDMPEDELKAYARSKEKLWNDLHGLHSQPFSAEDFRQYARYNFRTADALLQHAGELDAAYIHDFQLLQVGAMLGLAAPCVLRWHVPFNPQLIPAYTRHWMLRVMEDFDAVMVSTRRDLQGLVDAGFRGKVRQVYPHINAGEWPDTTPNQIAELEAQWNLQPDTRVFLLVARMDPMKRQDLAIRAFARIHKEDPKARLVLVGNGSFSGPMGGHTGKGKSSDWREKLKWIVAELGITNAVTFAHWIPDGLLAAAYSRADAVLLPSDIEGFGLTPLEAWRYGRVPIISKGCGAAEIIVNGNNGLLHEPGDEDGLADCMRTVLRDRAAAERMGESGRITLPNFTARQVNPTIRAIMDEVVESYRK
ncbi:MAG TPA: glycosyltransferase family 4 protein [Candidatus Thermoplasmatota archaeon]|nr:glycosyltransferase family 4 protein [Candidatus Thermoplasmatota archaeon]